MAAGDRGRRRTWASSSIFPLTLAGQGAGRSDRGLLDCCQETMGATHPPARLADGRARSAPRSAGAACRNRSTMSKSADQGRAVRTQVSRRSTTALKGCGAGNII